MQEAHGGLLELGCGDVKVGHSQWFQVYTLSSVEERTRGLPECL